MLWVEVKINEKSAMWDLIQEWLWGRMNSQGIQYRTKENSQEFPDFLLDANSDIIGLLEVKTFDYSKSPNFDVANFEAYVRSLETHAYRIDADYLIIGYTLNDWVINIKDIRLKKIWEICCASERFPLKTQIKQDMIYNIRPASWMSTRTSYPIFTSKEVFIEAIQNTLNMYTKTLSNHWYWSANVWKNYKEHLWK